MSLDSLNTSQVDGKRPLSDLFKSIDCLCDGCGGTGREVELEQECVYCFGNGTYCFCCLDDCTRNPLNATHPAAVLNSLRNEIYRNNLEKGWHQKEPSFTDIIALCHSELSEALEEYRNGRTEPIYFNPDKPDKPEGIGVELADCIIRILDYCGLAKIDIGPIILRKIEYNKTRPHRHGGKLI